MCRVRQCRLFPMDYIHEISVIGCLSSWSHTHYRFFLSEENHHTFFYFETIYLIHKIINIHFARPILQELRRIARRPPLAIALPNYTGHTSIQQNSGVNGAAAERRGELRPDLLTSDLATQQCATNHSEDTGMMRKRALGINTRPPSHQCPGTGAHR